MTCVEADGVLTGPLFYILGRRAGVLVAYFEA